MSSILKKQIVAVTGLLLVLFVLGHMAGNFMIFGGPEALNGYSEKLHHLGPILWIIRIALVLVFIVHIGLTIRLTLENRAARAGRYAVSNGKGDSGFAKTTMIYTGLLVVIFLGIHLADFTFPAKEGSATVVPGTNGEELALFGLVWNGFLKPWRAILYVIAVCLVGLHLSHGVQSLAQTLGIRHDKYTPMIEKASIVLGIVIAVGFGSVPVYVNIVRTPKLQDSHAELRNESKVVDKDTVHDPANNERSSE